LVAPGGTSGSRIFLAISAQRTTAGVAFPTAVVDCFEPSGTALAMVVCSLEKPGARTGAAGITVAPVDGCAVEVVDRAGATGTLVALICPLDKSVDREAVVGRSGGNTASRLSADDLSTSRASRDSALKVAVHCSSAPLRPTPVQSSRRGCRDRRGRRDCRGTISNSRSGSPRIG
jgi:hypothetical protein